MEVLTSNTQRPLSAQMHGTKRVRNIGTFYDNSLENLPSFLFFFTDTDG